MYKVRFLFCDGSKEDVFFNTKEKAINHRNIRKSSYSCVVKKRRR